MNCPICNKEIEDVKRDYIDYTLCEESWSCPDCKYFYVYAYGNTEVYIGKKEFYFGYRDTKENQQVQDQILLEEKRLRRRRKILRFFKRLLPF